MNLYLYFEFLALFVSLITFKKFGGSIFRYFIPYLSVIMLYEIGTTLGWFAINDSNLWAANVIITFEFTFYMLILSQLTTIRHIILRVLAVCLLITAINIIFIQGIWKLHTITIILQYGVIVYFVCVYFYELMNNAKTSMSIYTLPGFWLAAGLLFSCLGQIPVMSIFGFMAYDKTYDEFDYLLVYETISAATIYTLYSCLTISFLCFHRTSKLLP